MLLKSATVLCLISAASAEVLTVKVGAGDFIYTPNSVTANIDDIINFQFTGAPGNHTVSQAAFDKPCEQLPGGFDSGPVPVPEGFIQGPPPQWNLTISTSEPIWYYCKAIDPVPHCIAGMVGVINPTSEQTFDAWTNASTALMSLPSQSPGSMSGIGAAATAAPSPIIGSSTNTSSATTSATATATPTSSLSVTGASSSSTISPTSTKPNSASGLTSTGIWTLLATVLGLTTI